MSGASNRDAEKASETVANVFKLLCNYNLNMAGNKFNVELQLLLTVPPSPLTHQTQLSAAHLVHGPPPLMAQLLVNGLHTDGPPTLSPVRLTLLPPPGLTEPALTHMDQSSPSHQQTPLPAPPPCQQTPSL